MEGRDRRGGFGWQEKGRRQGVVGGMELCSSAHEDEVVADGKGHETKRAKLVWTITTVVMTLVMNMSEKSVMIKR